LLENELAIFLKSRGKETQVWVYQGAVTKSLTRQDKIVFLHGIKLLFCPFKFLLSLSLSPPCLSLPLSHTLSLFLSYTLSHSSLYFNLDSILPFSLSPPSAYPSSLFLSTLSYSLSLFLIPLSILSLSFSQKLSVEFNWNWRVLGCVHLERLLWAQLRLPSKG